MIIPASSCTNLCANFSANLKYVDIPEDSIKMVKLLILDWLGCAIKGSTNNFAKPAKKLLEFNGNNSQATVIGSTKLATIFDASFYNAYVGHIMEMDDVDRESITHPATVVIPAALAVGELKASSAQELITAIVAGYEVMLRIGAAITPKHYEIWHTTATAGTFGASIAASKLFNLSSTKTAWSLGNAGTMAAGLWQFLATGAMSKFLHTGKAASNGVLSAYLASEEFTGAVDILEGKQGFFAGFARQDVDYSIFEDFGKKYRTALVSIKPYPCCRHTHSSIDAANSLYLKHKDKEIKEVKAEVYKTAINVAGNPSPSTPQEAKFSLKYCIARTLQKGLVNDNDFNEDLLKDINFKKLMDRINVVESEELTKCMPASWPAIITVSYVDGSKETCRVDSPKGDPENPVSFDEAVQKFYMMTEGIADQNSLVPLVNTIKNIEELKDSGDILRLVNKIICKNTK